MQFHCTTRIINSRLCLDSASPSALAGPCLITFHLSSSSGSSSTSGSGSSSGSGSNGSGCKRIHCTYTYLKFVQSSALFNELPTGCQGPKAGVGPGPGQAKQKISSSSSGSSDGSSVGSSSRSRVPSCFSFSCKLLSQRRKQKPTVAVGASVSQPASPPARPPVLPWPCPG